MKQTYLWLYIAIFSLSIVYMYIQIDNTSFKDTLAFAGGTLNIAALSDFKGIFNKVDISNSYSLLSYGSSCKGGAILFN